jgi:hypothetical protein
MAEQQQITVKIDPDLRAALEQAAQAEHRTISGQVRHFVALALENSEAARQSRSQEQAA